MSELKVNKVTPRSGTTVTIGDSGDSVAIPTGVGFNGFGYRNIIINGDMSIAQRATTATGLGDADSGYHTVDRWRFTETGTVTFEFTQSQSTDVPTGQGFATSLKMDCTTAQASPAAGDFLQFQQRFEGQNLQYIKKGTANAVPLTLSFWVKSNKTGTYIVEIIDSDNSSRHINKSYTVIASDTWEKKTITYEGDTTGALNNDNTVSLNLNFYLIAGTNYTTGTLQTSWGSLVQANRAVGQVNLADDTANEWYITGVQLEAGTTASDFEFLPVDVNLGRCQRYFQKSYDLATAPATSTDQQKLELCITSDSANNAVFSTSYKVPLRTTPTITFYKGTGTSGSWSYERSGASSDATMTAYVGRYGENHLIAYGGVGAGYVAVKINGHYVASAEL